MATKYYFYPEWLRALHLSELKGTPAVREMAFNYPDDVTLQMTSHHRQFMIGDKIVVSYGIVTNPDEPLTVFLPTSHQWYSYSYDKYYKKVEDGKSNYVFYSILIKGSIIFTPIHLPDLLSINYAVPQDN